MEKETKLRKLMESKSGTVKAFAKEIDLPYTTIRSILERGIFNAKVENVTKICKGLGITTDEILQITNDNFQMIETEKIPVVAQISAGLPVYSEQDIIDFAYAPAYLKKNGRELFYLKVTGDSMDKEFKEGDLILVDMNSTVENGQIGVVQINGYNATVKRVKYDGDKIILLPESNNSDHLPQIYTKDDKVKIIGRVISAQKQY